MFEKGVSYSGINSAKCALSHIVNIPPCKVLSDHPLIAQYCKGLYNLRPPQPKLSFVWDVRIIFDYFTTQNYNIYLSDKLLRHKLLILLLLLGGQRMNTVHSFQVDKLLITSTSATFAPGHVLKHSRPGNKLIHLRMRLIQYKKKKSCALLKFFKNISSEDQQELITTQSSYLLHMANHIKLLLLTHSDAGLWFYFQGQIF